MFYKNIINRKCKFRLNNYILLYIVIILKRSILLYDISQAVLTAIQAETLLINIIPTIAI